MFSLTLLLFQSIIRILTLLENGILTCKRHFNADLEISLNILRYPNVITLHYSRKPFGTNHHSLTDPNVHFDMSSRSHTAWRR